MGIKLGIDLGTLFSRVCSVDEFGVVRILDTPEGGHSMPSVVFIDPNIGEVLVGDDAQLEGSLYPENLIEYIKLYLAEFDYSVSVNKTEYSAVDLCSFILSKLIRNAEMYFPEGEIEGAVIAYPIWLGDCFGHEALIKMAGKVVMDNGQRLKVLRFIPEFEAVGTAYIDLRNDFTKKNILVCDLGGTFSTCVLKLTNSDGCKSAKIVTCSGTKLLGGRNWTDAIAGIIRNKFCEQTGVDEDEMLSDPDQIQWYNEKSERVKRMLSSKEMVRITPSYNGYKEAIEVTREDFERATEFLLDELILTIKNMMSHADLSMENDIDEVVLVGGGCRMPQITTRLKTEFDKPTVFFMPEFAVAEGAAIIANSIK